MLVDFGIASFDGNPGRTQAGTSPGYSPMFAAPEQIHEHRADTRSDVFSLAGSLYFALTYDNPSACSPHRFRPEAVTDDRFRGLLIRSLDRAEPEHRPADAAAFRDALREATLSRVIEVTATRASSSSESPEQATEPSPKPAPAPRFTNSLGMTMVRIEPGEFLMGSTKAQIDMLLKRFPDAKREWFDDEQPQHPVKITRPFYLAAHQVTVGQFRRFVERSGHKTDDEWRNPGFDQREDHPVVNVSHDDAAGVPRLAERTGKGAVAGLPSSHGGGVGVCLPGRGQGGVRPGG